VDGFGTLEMSGLQLKLVIAYPLITKDKSYPLNGELKAREKRISFVSDY
jgi:hypothetical protein